MNKQFQYRKNTHEVLEQWIREFDLYDYSQAIRVCDFSKGERLFFDMFEGIVCVLDGELRALSSAKTGKEITLFALGVGEICAISSVCVISDFDLEMSFEAIQASTVAILPNTIADTVKSNIFQNKISSIIAKRLAQVLKTLNQVAFIPLSERVSCYLELCEKKEIKITHEEIANHLGSTREAISRILKEMEKNGKIFLHRKRIIKRE